MYKDYPVDERSDDLVRETAKTARSTFAVLEDDYVDLISTLRKTRINTRFGLKELRYKVGRDEDMQGTEGLTVFAPGLVTIVLSPTTHDALRFGDGRARNTAAHELGHAIMHQGLPMARGSMVGGANRWIPPYRSAEHQAKVFAPALLIDDTVALKLSVEKEVALRFGVSFDSAEIYLKNLRKPDERRRVFAELRRLTDKIDLSEGADLRPRFLSDPCPACGRLKLFPVGHKYMCQECDHVFDGFQDGDRID
jgi:IrrE N-terminal-like domain